MPNKIDDLLNPGFISPRRNIMAGELAKYLRSVSGTKAYSHMIVMQGGVTLTNLLLDAAATIEDFLKADALQREKGTIVEADLQNEIDLLRAEILELNRSITALKGKREVSLQTVAKRFKMLQKARDSLELAAVRFGNLSLHDDSMFNGVIPSSGCDEAIEAAHQITRYLEGRE